jgi:hypothetical protein
VEGLTATEGDAESDAVGAALGDPVGGGGPHPTMTAARTTNAAEAVGNQTFRGRAINRTLGA